MSNPILSIVHAAPQAPPEQVSGMQFGTGAVVLGLLVWTIAKVRNRDWPIGSVIVAFALGTLTVGASGLFGTPGEIVQNLAVSAGDVLGGLG